MLPVQGKSNKCLVIAYYTLNDPPTRNACRMLVKAGWDVSVIQPCRSHSNLSPQLDGVEVINYAPLVIPFLKSLRRAESVLYWIALKTAILNLLNTKKFSLVLTFMLHPLAVLPNKLSFKLISCVYDIPVIEDAGMLDRRLISRGWKKLADADIVWSSDIYKAQLTQKFGRLRNFPIICHNCPSLDYVPEIGYLRDPWLRYELQKQGANISDTGNILLRAGAIGESGGIEETLFAMQDLPSDYVFLMMGRPSVNYIQHIQQLINRLGLQKRAILWDRPTDEVWKKALLGSDIGHLIHGPFLSARATRLYEYNSSLSNNRLFNYMAAGLPVIAYNDPRMDGLYDEVSSFRITRLNHLQEDITKCWRELGNYKNLRSELGRAGRNAFLKKYNWEHQFMPVLQQIG